MARTMGVALVVTAAAVTLNIALVAPPAMVMDGGNVRLVLVEFIVTSRLV